MFDDCLYVRDNRYLCSDFRAGSFSAVGAWNYGVSAN